MMYAPRVSQDRHCGLARMNQKRAGRLRSAISSPPVSARKIIATHGAIKAKSRPWPTFMLIPSAPTKAAPADTDLVQRYADTRHRQTIGCDTSYATRASADGWASPFAGFFNWFQTLKDDALSVAVPVGRSAHM